MEFDVYCTPPTSKEIATERAMFSATRKKARFFSLLLVAAWAAGIWFLWNLKFAHQNIVFGIGGGMVALVLLSRILGGARASVAAAACVMAALASTIAMVWGLTQQDNLPIAIYAGLGGGFLLGAVCMLTGSRLRLAQEGLRPLKPVSTKRKPYLEIVDLCKRHPVLEAYRERVALVDRPLIKGEIEAMKAWAAKSSKLMAVAATLVAEPRVEEPPAPAPEPEKVEAPVAEAPAESPEAQPKEVPESGEAERPEPGPSLGTEETVVEAEILPDEKQAESPGEEKEK